MQALLLPIDDRPVTAVFPQLVCQIAGVRTVVPPRSLLGSLQTPAQPEALLDWVTTAIANAKPDALLLCLDNLIYGGLINSRRSPDTLPEVLQRAARLTRFRQTVGPNCPILAQSSIMRISDNYDATEEMEYWSRYGRDIFNWSELLHRIADGDRRAAGQLAGVEMRIPADVRQDYQRRRYRNFQVNRKLLEYVSDGTVDFLSFSLDDSGAAGLNVLEQSKLTAEVERLGLDGHVMSYAGADEVLCALAARWLLTKVGAAAQVSVKYSSEEARHCLSRYEGQPIEQTVEAQLKACGLKHDETGPAAFTVVLHGTGRQGDHVWLPGQPDLRQIDTARAADQTISLLESIKGPYVLCDKAYSNGSDPVLVEALLKRPDLMRSLWGYAGWNTTGNSVGSALAMATARWAADRFGVEAAAADAVLRKCLFVRLADDWAYQTQVRPQLKQLPDNTVLRATMTPLIERIGRALTYQPALELGFPWRRTFEVEIRL